VAVIEPIHIIVPGEPVAQGRPRFSTRAGHTKVYDPPKSRGYKDYIRTIASSYKRADMLAGPVMMRVDIYRGIPKSWTLKKQKQAEDGIIKPTLKPDVDNYVKAIKDALNGIVYVDDSQVTCLIISKYYATEPRVEIRVEVDEIATASERGV
jgi:Holliday junction resolvase RusA-like endonuclease